MSTRTRELVQFNPGLNIVGQPHVITVHKGVASVLTFKGIGGQVGKYVFSLLAGFGTPPPGMAFADHGATDGTATISGTPTAYGDYPITMVVETAGSIGPPVKKSFILRVPELTLQFVQTAPVYAGVPTTPGQLKLVAQGGSGTGYAYSLSTYPALVDPVTGYITPGTLPAPGTYTDTATVTDSASNSKSIPIALIVFPSVSFTANPPSGERLVAYSYQLSATTYGGAVTWSRTGSLPAGITMSPSGLISGSSAVAFGNPSVYAISVTATNAAGSSVTNPVTLNFYSHVLGATNLSGNFANVLLGTHYDNLKVGFAVFGVAPYYFTIDVSGLPWATDNGDGTISGTPTGTAFTTINIPFTVTDALGATSAASTYFNLVNAQHTVRVQQSGADVGDAGPRVLNFVGPTVTDDLAGGRTVTFGSASALDADTDGTLAANSDSRIATQKATKTYVDNAVTGLFDFKGATNCSANPNYPAASKGDAYVVSAAGKIGGASGAAVDIGDVYVASADNAGGTQAGVGASWFILEHNLTGALLTANNLSDVASAVGSLDNLTKQGADIASAATPDIAAATGRNINITGTTTITGFTSAPAGVERITRFTGALTLTHNAASLILVTAANIITAADDIAEWLSLGSGNWRMTSYQRADGTALAGGGGGGGGSAVSFSPAALAAGVQAGNLSSSIMTGANTTVGANQCTGAVFYMGASGHTCIGVQAFIFNTTGAPLTYTLDFWDGVSATLLGTGNVTVPAGTSGLYSISFGAIALTANHTYIASIWETTGTWVTYAGSQAPSFASPINAGNDLIYFSLRAYAFGHTIPSNPQYAYSACVEPLIT
jgi:hypothetical protein